MAESLIAKLRGRKTACAAWQEIMRLREAASDPARDEGRPVPDRPMGDPSINSEGEFAAKPGQIESGIDLPHQVIFRNGVVELKLAEKLRLFARQLAMRQSRRTFARIARKERGWPHYANLPT